MVVYKNHQMLPTYLRGERFKGQLLLDSKSMENSPLKSCFESRGSMIGFFRLLCRKTQIGAVQIDIEQNISNRPSQAATYKAYRPNVNALLGRTLAVVVYSFRKFVEICFMAKTSLKIEE